MREKSFGPYRVLRSLGAGGMGEVLLAEHELIGRKAAIKVLHLDRAEKREAVDRFFNEARAAAVISDPGIVQIYDFGFSPSGTGYIVMECLEGETLKARLHRVGTLPITDALRIARQIAGSLGAVHAVGIVHRDLKPDNVMMVRDADVPGGERPKILDFGIAKLEFESTRFKTRTGAVMGTPLYMSPEQCNDSGKIDHRSDIYSLGCVLYHLLTGQPPFDIAGVGAVISAHMNQMPLPPSAVVTYLPQLIDQLVMRCLAKDPNERFSSMAEFQGACDHAITESARWTPAPIPVHAALTMMDPTGGPAARTTLGGSVGQSFPPVRRSRGIWIGLVAVLVLVGVGVTAKLATSDDDQIQVQPAASPVTVEPIAAPKETPPPPPESEVKQAEPVKPEPVKVEPAPAPAPEPAATPAEKPVEKKVAPPKRTRTKPKTKANELYDDRG